MADSQLQGRDSEIEAPIQFVPGIEAPPRRRCGPWETRDGMDVCLECGRVDFDLDEEAER